MAYTDEDYKRSIREWDKNKYENAYEKAKKNDDLERLGSIEDRLILPALLNIIAIGASNKNSYGEDFRKYLVKKGANGYAKAINDFKSANSRGNEDITLSLKDTIGMNLEIFRHFYNFYNKKLGGAINRGESKKIQDQIEFCSFFDQIESEKKLPVSKNNRQSGAKTVVIHRGVNKAMHEVIANRILKSIGEIALTFEDFYPTLQKINIVNEKAPSLKGRKANLVKEMLGYFGGGVEFSEGVIEFNGGVNKGASEMLKLLETKVSKNWGINTGNVQKFLNGLADEVKNNIRSGEANASQVNEFMEGVFAIAPKSLLNSFKLGKNTSETTIEDVELLGNIVRNRMATELQEEVSGPSSKKESGVLETEITGNDVEIALEERDIGSAKRYITELCFDHNMDDLVVNKNDQEVLEAFFELDDNKLSEILGEDVDIDKLRDSFDDLDLNLGAGVGAIGHVAADIAEISAPDAGPKKGPGR